MSVEELLERASSVETVSPHEAETLYLEVLLGGESDIRAKESAATSLAHLYGKQKQGEELGALMHKLRPFFLEIPKAKTAKIVKTIIDELSLVPGTLPLQAQLCEESIAWCLEHKRTFLRHRLESKLAVVYFKKRDFSDALRLIGNTMREVRKLEDKPLMMEIQLTESQVHYALSNTPKAKASLTSARTLAASVYCPPALQAAIDLQAGILAADEGDFRTGFSYFYEAFENYVTQKEHTLALQSLQYMLLSKIMDNKANEVDAVIMNKNAMQFAGPEVEIFKGLAAAYKARSLSQFEDILNSNKEVLTSDAVITMHLNRLYHTLLENNLLRIIEPFSRVQTQHVADLIELPLKDVEAKLSQMILDQKFHGTLDQGMGSLIIFDAPEEERTFTAAIETMEHLNKVVDALAERAGKLNN